MCQFGLERGEYVILLEEGIYDLWYPHPKKDASKDFFSLNLINLGVYYHILKTTTNLSIASTLISSRNWGRSARTNNFFYKFMFSRSCHLVLNEIFS